MDRLITPEIGALVEYGLDGFGKGPGRYRVSGWMRVAPTPVFAEDDIFGEILLEGCQEIRGHRMQWCLQEEATHVSLKGICGVIAPIEEVRVIGMVDCPPEFLEGERARAVQRGLKHKMLF